MPKPDETGGVNWLREDFRDMREKMDGMTSEVGRLAGAVEGFGEQLVTHAVNCPAIAALKNPPPIPRLSLNPGKAGTTLKWAIRLGPIILAAALGLLGLGAYLSTGDPDATIKAIRAVSDTTMKLAADIEKIQAAVDAGEK